LIHSILFQSLRKPFDILESRMPIPTLIPSNYRNTVAMWTSIGHSTRTFLRITNHLRK